MVEELYISVNEKQSKLMLLWTAEVNETERRDKSEKNKRSNMLSDCRFVPGTDD